MGPKRWGGASNSLYPDLSLSGADRDAAFGPIRSVASSWDWLFPHQLPFGLSVGQEPFGVPSHSEIDKWQDLLTS